MVVPFRSLTWETPPPAGVAVSPAIPSSPTSPARAANLPHPEKLSRFRVRVILDLPRLDDLRSNPHDSTPWAPPRPARSRVVSWLDCPCRPSSLWATVRSRRPAPSGLGPLAQRSEGRQGQSSIQDTTRSRARRTAAVAGGELLRGERLGGAPVGPPVRQVGVAGAHRIERQVALPDRGVVVDRAQDFPQRRGVHRGLSVRLLEVIFHGPCRSPAPLGIQVELVGPDV